MTETKLKEGDKCPKCGSILFKSCNGKYVYCYGSDCIFKQEIKK